MGHNPMEKFIGNLSKVCNLSDYYTNHCIGTTKLTRENYSPHQIMAITGHKSIQSLGIYQRVKADEKLMMGMSLTYSLFRPPEVAKIVQDNMAK